jgi:hypothetical protein
MRRVRADGTGDSLHKQRSYVLAELAQLIGRPLGAIAECGVYQGLSSSQLCEIFAPFDAPESPLRYHIFDSFEGLSAIATEDRINVFHSKLSLDTSAVGTRGLIASSLEDVQRNLSDFPFVTYHKGWIPASLIEVEGVAFSFVHIDLDLYEPILEAARFFHRRMLPGGIIVFDDYGFVDWPGAKLAVEQFLGETGQRAVRLTTGQAIMFANRV